VSNFLSGDQDGSLFESVFLPLKRGKNVVLIRKPEQKPGFILFIIWQPLNFPAANSPPKKALTINS
jgi:hypothetical protein